jgi:putative tryptophan/tyrosine transport system substrate-binding protein
MMKRREFITLLGSAAAYPATGWGQEAKLPTIPRIGCLVFGAAAVSGSRVEVLDAALRELGYVEGKNIVMETMWAETVDELPGLAAELVRRNVNAIFAPSSTEVEPARQATHTIPIVFSFHADPVGVGHVASLPRPGGNITGLTMLLTDLSAKELEILQDAVPQAERIGVLWNPTTPSHAPALPFRDFCSTAALPLKPDIGWRGWHVRKVPATDICSAAKRIFIGSPRPRVVGQAAAPQGQAPWRFAD